MALIVGQRAEITVGVNGTEASRRDLETVADALRRLNAQTLERLSNQMGAINNQFTALRTTIGAFVAFEIGQRVVSGFVEKIGNAINVLGDLDDMAQKTGASVENLSRLQKVANAFGTEFEAVDAAVAKLAKGMAGADEVGTKTQRALAALGISARDSAHKLRDPAEVMIETAKALQRYQDGAGKTALINDLLGKSGANLLPYLNDVAESVDEFGAVSAETAARAAKMQDSIGRLRVKTDELATTVGLAAAPAVDDLAGAVLDVMKGNDQLASGNGADWADNMAVGVARLLDVVTVLPKAFTAVSSSFKVVAADIVFAAELAQNATPSAMASRVAQGRNPIAELRTALAERNKVLDAANAQYDELWNKPANQFEQAMLKRLSARGTTAGAGSSKPEDGQGQGTLDDYLKKQAAAEAAAATAKANAAAAQRETDAYTALMASIRSKTNENLRELDLGEKLTDSQKTRIRLDEELAAGTRKLTTARRDAVYAALDEQAASEKVRQEQTAQTDVSRFIAASTAARDQSAAALNLEYQLYGKSADAREMAMVAVRAEADMQKQLTEMRIAGLPVTTQVLAQLEAEKSARVLVEQATAGQTKALAYAAQLREQNQRATAEGIADPQQRAQALLAIDAEVWKERIRLAGNGTTAQRELQSEYNAWYARSSKQSFADVDLTRATQLLQVMESVDEAARQAAAGMEQSFGRVGKAIGGLTTSLSGYARSQATIAAQLTAAMGNAKGDPNKMAKANADALKQTSLAQVRSYGDMATAAKGFFEENSAGYRTLEMAEKGFRAYEMAMQLKSLYTHMFVTTAKASGTVAGQATETGAVVAGEAARNTAKVPGVFMSFMSALGPWGMAAAGVAIAAVLGGAFGGKGGGMGAAERQRTQGTGTVLGDSSAKSESIGKAIELSAANSKIELNYTAGMLRALLSIESSMSGLGNLLTRNGDVGGALPVDTVGTMGSLGSAIGSPLKFMPGADKLGDLYSKVTNGIFGGNVSTIDGGIKASSTTLSGVRAGKLAVQGYVDTKKDGGIFHSDKYKTDLKNLGAETNQQFSLVITSLAKSVGEAANLLGLGGSAFTQRLDAFVVDMGKISTKDLKPEEIQQQLEAAFSKVGDDMARWAVGGLTAFQKAGEGAFETLSRIAVNYANLDSILTSVGKTFGAAGLSSIAMREQFIEMAGGIDQLASKAAGFADNFLTEAERLAPVQKYVAEQLSAMGLSALRSRESFKQYVLGLDLTSQAQREQYVALMDLQDAFAKVYPEIVDTTVSLADAKSALADAYNAESDALNNTIDKMGSFASALRKLPGAAMLGNLSPLSPQQKYIEARAQYETVLAAARAGDESAQSEYQGAFTAFLDASRAVFASSAQYQADFAYALSATEEAATWAELQANIGKAQLTALESQVSGLIEVKKEVMSVRDAILQLNAIMARTAAPFIATAPPVSVAVPYNSYGTQNTEALVAEVKALRAEVAGLRGDQQQQTGDLITAQFDSGEEAASRITAGMTAATYTEKRTQPA